MDNQITYDININRIKDSTNKVDIYKWVLHDGILCNPVYWVL